MFIRDTATSSAERTNERIDFAHIADGKPRRK